MAVFVAIRRASGAAGGHTAAIAELDQHERSLSAARDEMAALETERQRAAAAAEGARQALALHSAEGGPPAGGGTQALEAAMTLAQSATEQAAAAAVEVRRATEAVGRAQREATLLREAADKAAAEAGAGRLAGQGEDDADAAAADAAVMVAESRLSLRQTQLVSAEQQAVALEVQLQEAQRALAAFVPASAPRPQQPALSQPMTPEAAQAQEHAARAAAAHAEALKAAALAELRAERAAEAVLGSLSETESVCLNITYNRFYGKYDEGKMLGQLLEIGAPQLMATQLSSMMNEEESAQLNGPLRNQNQIKAKLQEVPSLRCSIEPTEEQKLAAQQAGINVSGVTFGDVSEAERRLQAKDSPSVAFLRQQWPESAQPVVEGTPRIGSDWTAAYTTPGASPAQSEGVLDSSVTVISADARRELASARVAAMDADTAAANAFADSSAARWDVASVLQQEPQLLPSSPPQEQEVQQVSAEDVAAQQALAAAVRERQVEYDAAQRLVELGREELAQAQGALDLARRRRDENAERAQEQADAAMGAARAGVMAAEKAAQGGAERLAHAQSALAEAEAQHSTAVQAQAELQAEATALESGVAAAAAELRAKQERAAASAAEEAEVAARLGAAASRYDESREAMAAARRAMETKLAERVAAEVVGKVLKEEMADRASGAARQSQRAESVAIAAQGAAKKAARAYDDAVASACAAAAEMETVEAEREAVAAQVESALVYKEKMDAALAIAEARHGAVAEAEAALQRAEAAAAAEDGARRGAEMAERHVAEVAQLEAGLQAAEQAVARALEDESATGVLQEQAAACRAEAEQAQRSLIDAQAREAEAAEQSEAAAEVLAARRARLESVGPTAASESAAMDARTEAEEASESLRVEEERLALAEAREKAAAQLAIKTKAEAASTAEQALQELGAAKEANTLAKHGHGEAKAQVQRLEEALEQAQRLAAAAKDNEAHALSLANDGDDGGRQTMAVYAYGGGATPLRLGQSTVSAIELLDEGEDDDDAEAQADAHAARRGYTRTPSPERTSPRPASRRKDVAAEAREKANPYSRPWTVHQKRHHLTRAARSPSCRSQTPSPRRGRNGENPRAAERFRDVEERHSVHHRARPTSLERLASPTRSRQDSRTLRRTAEAVREEGYVGEKTLGEALAMHSHGYKRTGAESPFEDAEPAYEEPSYEDLPQVRLEQAPRYMNAVEQSLEQGKQRAESRKMRAEEAAAEKAERRVREEETVAARKARADYDTRKQRARSAPKSKGRRRRRGAPSCYVSQEQMAEQQAGLQQRRRDAERQAEQEESRQKWGADVRRLWTLFVALNDQVSYGAETSDDEALCGVLLEHKGLALSRGQCQRLIELLRAGSDADEVVSQLTETFELGRSWSQAMRTGRAQQQATQRRMDEWEQARRDKVESERTRQEEEAAAELLETPLPANSFAKRAGDTGSAAVSRRSTSPTASVRSGSSTSSRHHAHTSASLEKGTKGALEAELRRQAEWRAAANPSLDHSFAARAASPAPSEGRRPLSTQVTLLLTKLRSLSYSANGQSPEKLFNHFDRNNSGVLEEREFLQVRACLLS